jgi:hypothetical protein
MSEQTPPETIAEAIEQSAIGGIKKGSEEGREFEKHSIDDQIKAAQYVAAKRAAGKAHFGLRFTKLVPPGAG